MSLSINHDILYIHIFAERKRIINTQKVQWDIL